LTSKPTWSNPGEPGFRHVGFFFALYQPGVLAMLVLTRRVGEEIVIDGDIRITVTAIIGNKVRIGVTAPESIRVDRKEIHELRVPPGVSVCPPAAGSIFGRLADSLQDLRDRTTS
jgi:carbon storage regulator